MSDLLRVYFTCESLHMNCDHACVAFKSMRCLGAVSAYPGSGVLQAANIVVDSRLVIVLHSVYGCHYGTKLVSLVMLSAGCSKSRRNRIAGSMNLSLTRIARSAGSSHKNHSISYHCRDTRKVLCAESSLTIAHRTVESFFNIRNISLQKLHLRTDSEISPDL